MGEIGSGLPQTALIRWPVATDGARWVSQACARNSEGAGLTWRACCSLAFVADMFAFLSGPLQQRGRLSPGQTE